MKSRHFIAAILVVLAVSVAAVLDNAKPDLQTVGRTSTIASPPIVPIVVSGIFPDPAFTPGATNPAITQANISQNICNPKWSTKSVRPTSSYTTALKVKQLASGYAVNGDTNTADYEEDHLISLEIGGNPTDPHNLWPELWESRAAKLAPKGTGAESKDKIENRCHAAVCSGTITLADAQHQIATNWGK